MTLTPPNDDPVEPDDYRCSTRQDARFSPDGRGFTH